jgi:hypothetical protein
LVDEEVVHDQSFPLELQDPYNGGHIVEVWGGRSAVAIYYPLNNFGFVCAQNIEAGGVSCDRCEGADAFQFGKHALDRGCGRGGGFGRSPFRALIHARTALKNGDTSYANELLELAVGQAKNHWRQHNDGPELDWTASIIDQLRGRDFLASLELINLMGEVMKARYDLRALVRDQNTATQYGKDWVAWRAYMGGSKFKMSLKTTQAGVG